MRAGRAIAVLIACGALPACGALLDLDVHYVATGAGDAGAGVDGEAPEGAAPDGSGGGDEGAADAAGSDADSASPASDGAPGDAGADAPPLLDGGGPTFVQGTAVSVDTTGMSATLDFADDVQDHDTIVVAVDYQSTPGLTVSDSIGNMFQPALAPIASGGTTCALWYALDVMGGPDTVRVATMPGNSGFFELYIHEYAGIAAFDAAHGAVGTAALMESGFVTTTAPYDLVFGYGVTGGAMAGAGFTLRSSLNSNVTEDQVAIAPGQHEATARTKAGSAWIMLTAAFLSR